MNKLIVTAVATLFAANLAFAQAPAAKSEAKPAAPSMPAATAAAAGGDCEAQAVDKNGKPLHGAAKSAFMKKCTGGSGPVGEAKGRGDCEAKAVSKAGKPLHGAAKDKFMKKCEAAAKG